MDLVANAAPAAPAGAPAVPGNRGIWVGILCELSEFALMFLAWAWFRLVHPADFHAGPAMLNASAGLANTLVMLTSGYLALRAVMAIRNDDVLAARNWLVAALLGGWFFLSSRPWSSGGT